MMKMQHASWLKCKSLHSRRPDLCPANQRRKDLCNLHICARAGANTKIYIGGARTQSRSRQQQSGVYNSITVYLCPPPLHLNNCKIISVVCVFACHRSDTIFEFIYQSALFAFIELCALALLVHRREFANAACML
jgi:hypothetical protein